MTAFDPARWALLSPRLDELLELPPAARAERLSRLREESPEDARHLQQMLERLPALEDERFLEDGAVPPPAGSEGRVVGAYTLERELGHGGMGEVWLARRTDGRFEGRVAIKFLQAGFFGEAEAARFAREGSILARLSHPHVARLLDAGVTGDAAKRPYLVLEYVDGVAIDTWCSARALGPRDCLALLLDVMDAVAHAHTRLILHRDLKPSNILVDREGRVKLLDFGVAKLLDESGQGDATALTQRAGAAFTPLYAAPEQVQGGDVTTATDVYALGVLMYRLLSGSHPIEGAQTGSTLDRLRALVETEPRRLSDAALRAGGPGAARRARELRGDLDTLVARALKKSPAERYPNAAALAEDVRRVLAHEPIAARPDGAGYRLAKFVRRHRAGVAAGAIAGVALAAGATVALVQAREARQQREQAEGLVEFMIGDLRKKLQPVGRLDALDAAGTRALAYYAAQDATRLDADSLGRRARALHLIGEIAEQRGRLDDAARMFREAAASTRELLARHPRDGQRVYDHAQSEFWVGYIGRRLGRLQDEEAGFTAYHELAERLVALDPTKDDWRMERAYALENMGMLRLDGARPAEALPWYDQAHRQFEAERAAHPEVAGEIANLLGWVARAHEAVGDYRAALRDQQDKLAELARAPDAKSDRESEVLRAVALHEAGRLHLWLDEAAEGEPLAREAVRLARREADYDPGNLDWQAAAAIASFGLADLLHARADDGGARQALAAGARIVDHLVAADPRKAYFSVALRSRMLVLQSRLTPEDPSLTGRLRAYADALPGFEGSGQSLDIEGARDAAAALLALGDREAAAGTDEGRRLAAMRWRAVLAHVARDAARDDCPALALRAHALLRLGDTEGARALAARLQRTPLRSPAMQDLSRRLAAVRTTTSSAPATAALAR